MHLDKNLTAKWSLASAQCTIGMTARRDQLVSIEPFNPKLNMFHVFSLVIRDTGLSIVFDLLFIKLLEGSKNPETL